MKIYSRKPALVVVEEEEILPHGLNRWSTCGLVATCRACDRNYIWEAEVEDFDFDMSYCGGSPQCTP